MFVTCIHHARCTHNIYVEHLCLRSFLHGRHTNINIQRYYCNDISAQAVEGVRSRTCLCAANGQQIRDECTIRTASECCAGWYGDGGYNYGKTNRFHSDTRWCYCITYIIHWHNYIYNKHIACKFIQNKNKKKRELLCSIDLTVKL